MTSPPAHPGSLKLKIPHLLKPHQVQLLIFVVDFDEEDQNSNLLDSIGIKFESDLYGPKSISR